MIDITVVDKAVQLKKEMDAAYLVFKKTPSVEASARWTAATRAYNDYCVKTISKLVDERIEDVNHLEDIINNFDKYSKCETCGAEILFRVNGDKFVASSDYVEGFPGWCYPCLVEYCTTHDCKRCDVTSDHSSCKFAEVKKLHVQEEA